MRGLPEAFLDLLPSWGEQVTQDLCKTARVRAELKHRTAWMPKRINQSLGNASSAQACAWRKGTLATEPASGMKFVLLSHFWGWTHTCAGQLINRRLIRTRLPFPYVA